MKKMAVRRWALLAVAGALAACAPRGGYVTVDGAMLGTTLHVTGDVTGCDRGELYAAVMELDELTDVDGQRGARFPLRIECLPGELRVFCPPEK